MCGNGLKVEFFWYEIKKKGIMNMACRSGKFHCSILYLGFCCCVCVCFQLEKKIATGEHHLVGGGLA